MQLPDWVKDFDNTNRDYTAFDFVINSYHDAKQYSATEFFIGLQVWTLAFVLCAYFEWTTTLWWLLGLYVFLDVVNAGMVSMYLTPNQITKHVNEKHMKERPNNIRDMFSRLKITFNSLLVYIVFVAMILTAFLVQGLVYHATLFGVNSIMFVYYTWKLQREFKDLEIAVDILKSNGRSVNANG